MDNSMINFQSFSSLWEEGKCAAKATSATSVPNQGQNTDSLKASAASRHRGIPFTTTFFTVLIRNRKAGHWSVTQNFRL